MNMFLHGMDGARVEWCNTITGPKLLEADRLMKFDVVVANPPFSLDKWGHENAEADRFKRFLRGTPPKSKGDYAFILHMIAVAHEGHGKVGVIVPHGVLFRGGAEGVNRRKLVEENLLEAVVGLPANLFFGTGIPAAILVFNKGKKHSDVLFIEPAGNTRMGRTEPPSAGGHREDHPGVQGRKSVEKYAYRATLGEIRDNEFNLISPATWTHSKRRPRSTWLPFRRKSKELRPNDECSQGNGLLSFKELGLIISIVNTHYGYYYYYYDYTA
jgi:type I restriction enzyme M protein